MACSSVRASYRQKSRSHAVVATTPITQRAPPLTIDVRTLVSVGHQARAGLTTERPERVAEHLDPGQPAAHLVRDGLVPDHRAEQHRRPCRRHRRARRTPIANQMFGASPASPTEAPQQMVAITTARPWWWTRLRPAAGQAGGHRADRLRAVEETEQFRFLQDLGGEGREQHDRHRHEHADHVDDVRAEQVLAAVRVDDPLADPAQARWLAVLVHLVRTQARYSAVAITRPASSIPNAQLTPAVPTSTPPSAGPAS